MFPIRKREQESFRFLEEELRQHPDNVEAQVRKAVMLNKMGKHEQTIELLVGYAGSLTLHTFTAPLNGAGQIFDYSRSTTTVPSERTRSHPLDARSIATCSRAHRGRAAGRHSLP